MNGQKRLLGGGVSLFMRPCSLAKSKFLSAPQEDAHGLIRR
jgi:hypothetical protein